MSVGAAKRWSLRKIDTSTAFLKSDPVRRKIWLTRLMLANLKADEVLLAEKAIYGLAVGPSDFFRTADTFLRHNALRGTRTGYGILLSALDPCL